MEETINKISKKAIEELHKSKKPIYPLYYKEVFNSIADEKGILNQLNPKLLCITPSINEKILDSTKEMIKNVNMTSKTIKTTSEEIIEEINELNLEEIKTAVIKFSTFLINNINELEEKIHELENELDKAYKELLIDPLTKAYNKKALEKDLSKILEKGKDRDLDLVIAFLDMDNFKQINDKYGHLVGDFVLIKFVSILKSLLRSSDKIYRFGGDEFVIVFNRSSLNNAIKTIERILNRIKKTKLKYKDQIIEFSISIGVTAHKKGDSLESLLKRADEALYEAKLIKKIYKVKQ